jgi:hypothetical protein
MDIFGYLSSAKASIYRVLPLIGTSCVVKILKPRGVLEPYFSSRIINLLVAFEQREEHGGSPHRRRGILSLLFEVIRPGQYDIKR